MAEADDGGLSEKLSGKLSFRQRVLVILPSFRRDPSKKRLGERLSEAMLKPEDPGRVASKRPEEFESIEELSAAARGMSDMERLVGLAAAPLGAAIGLVVVNDLIAHDPPSFIDGHPNKLHVSLGLYHELLVAMVALSLVTLLAAFFRKRMPLALSLALYGITTFNLKYWGFGIPFVFAGAWFLVRAYRLNRQLKVATGEVSSPRGTRQLPPTNRGEPRASKRYTPAPRRRRLSN